MSDEKEGAVVGGINHSAGKVVRQNIKSALTNWQDMVACGMSKSAVETAYTNRFGVHPDEVHLNDQFCKDYGWLSYNEMGTVTYYNQTSVPKTKISAERTLKNDTDTPVTHSVTLTSQESNSATVSVKNSSSISTGITIQIGPESLGIGGSFSTSFSVSNENSSSSTQTMTITVSDTVTIEVPPHSKRKVSLKITWVECQEDFEIPFYIQPYGLTGAQFYKQVEGHYHWGHTHRGFFQPPFTSKLTGTVLASLSTSGQLVIGDLEAE